MSATTVTSDTLAELPPRQQVETLIRTWLNTGCYGPGDLLPTARDIAHFCNDISRPTVRRVLKVLIEEGLLRGVPGKGVYVESTKPQPKPAIRVVPAKVVPHECC
ncbi:transcriptional regulator [Opitutaceae bacterium TAV1]|nr:transcriptional regulator [Opitutaceae bacterium TAV1]